jgi:FKBP-type peptidyl-prolyl cis-trans isomerase SlyD
LDKNIFMQNGVLMEIVKEGAQLMMQTYNGPMAGVVMEIGDNHVKMDFNHDLAGVPLCFSGEILNVRESTDDDFSDSCGGSCESCSGCH